MNPFTFFFFQKFFRTEKFARSQPAADSFRVERHFETPFEQVNNFQRVSFLYHFNNGNSTWYVSRVVEYHKKSFQQLKTFSMNCLFDEGIAKICNRFNSHYSFWWSEYIRPGQGYFLYHDKGQTIPEFLKL